MKFESYIQFWLSLPENEKIIVDYLREIILKSLPEYCKEKLTFNVPYYYGKRRICLIWPASVKGGGIKNGVLLGFAQGNKLNDPHQYLEHGTNKQIFYKIYQNLAGIEEKEIVLLIKNAVILDKGFK